MGAYPGVDACPGHYGPIIACMDKVIKIMTVSLQKMFCIITKEYMFHASANTSTTAVFQTKFSH